MPPFPFHRPYIPPPRIHHYPKIHHPPIKHHHHHTPFRHYPSGGHGPSGPYSWVGEVIGLIILAIFFFGFWLPGWQDMQRKHKEFDREWNRTRKEMKRRHREFDQEWERNRRQWPDGF